MAYDTDDTEARFELRQSMHILCSSVEMCANLLAKGRAHHDRMDWPNALVMLRAARDSLESVDSAKQRLAAAMDCLEEYVMDHMCKENLACAIAPMPAPPAPIEETPAPPTQEIEVRDTTGKRRGRPKGSKNKGGKKKNRRA